MKYGLVELDLETIVNTISTFEEIEKAILFGSRAKGNHKPGSDIDIAIYGKKMDIHIVTKLHTLLEEQSHMPYFFDVIDGTHLNHNDLKDHINRVGKVIYSK
ncbi:nucleotidyltransferase domain-containing protein [Chengkuizengella marina]|uniref:Nucleotidyltransferase domain-containing protein n=1 Tax=Chengkuizengella marina TaxID=2507566 RepID=A0A6N9Q385_9BACL|nr:nucleotidyltransferase domain-containing protein [Chengkuizengella marina]NBI29275.1 nucleotidyltransferase domain-containing protein [Chengkuizengella marina]